MGQLAGKTALVTGGISGIGQSIAGLFKQEGATVIASARNVERKAEAASLIGRDCDEIIAYDAAAPSAIETACMATANKHGQLDIVVLNAGVGHLRPFEMMDEEAFDQTMQTNVKGVFFGVQKALPYLADGASIIVTTSVATRTNDPMTSAYAPSKAAAAKMVEVLAVALRDRDLRINAVSPGPVHTPIFGKAGLPPEHVGPFLDQLAKQSATGRISKPEDLGQAALFLASDRAANITGAELVVDGGFSLMLPQAPPAA